jgi:hypothetical protein
MCSGLCWGGCTCEEILAEKPKTLTPPGTYTSLLCLQPFIKTSVEQRKKEVGGQWRAIPLYLASRMGLFRKGPGPKIYLIHNKFSIAYRHLFNTYCLRSTTRKTCMLLTPCIVMNRAMLTF